MNNKKIVVFWDNKDFWETNNNGYIVCSSHSEFNDLDEATLKDAGGFLVLCELPWDHESAVVPRSEFGGIRLVQRFIRDKMSLKAPVVFTSFSDAFSICEIHKEYKIVKTPALQHQFIRLPALRKELARKFLDMNNLTDTELAYTKLIYCDIKGLLVQINHVLEGRDKSEQENYRKDLEYVLKEQFYNDEELMEEYHNAENLSDFCKILLARMEASDNPSAHDGFLDDQKHETIRILLIEDELEKDENVKQFFEYIQEIEEKAAEQKEIEIKVFEKDAKALKEETETLVSNGIKDANNIVKIAKTLAIRMSNKELASKALTLEGKIEVLEEISKEIENKKEIRKREFGEEEMTLENKAKAIVEETKKTAQALEKIAEAEKQLAIRLNENVIIEKATILKEKAKLIKEQAKALEKRTFTKPLFTITVEKNTDNIEYDNKHCQHESTPDHSLKEFDVVISDIEIRDDEDRLVILGFNVIETMAKESKRPLYYIVTNVSRSFYDQIKNPYVRRIRLKKEVFGTKESIKTFLYGIKEVYDNREAEAAEKETKWEILFSKMFDYINKNDIYPKQLGKPFVKDGSSLIEIHSYADIEEKIIKEKSLELIKRFLTLFNENNFQPNDDNGANFIVFHNNCEVMRKQYISNEKNNNNLGQGNGNFDKIIAKREKNHQELTTEDVANFIVKLIMRRFFLFVKGFIDYYTLMESFEKYKNNSSLFDKNTLEDNKKIKKLTYKDIACRAIGEQFMTLHGEKDNSKKLIDKRDQSHCYDETLLWSKARESLRLTDEEKDFVDALESTESVFSTDKEKIENLRINY